MPDSVQPDDVRERIAMGETMFRVEYQYATYSGAEYVVAEDGEQAVAIAKRRLRRYMTLPMAYERWTANEATDAR